MKKNLFPIVCLLIIACNSKGGETKILQERVDSLEKKISDSYKPGFGEFMSSIQVHHAKLWFAGEAGNWPLADFEIHEIMESVEALKKYQSERVESRSIPMLEPALDSVNTSIQKKDPVAFKNSFVLLTNTCNNCHKAVSFSFNEVKIPTSPPFSNQQF